MKFEIWDTAGQERYHSLAPMYYRGAHAAVVVYDITNGVCTVCILTIKESFERAKKWVAELQKQAQPNITIALVGNKLDLESSRQVPTEQAQAYVEDENLVFLETSAKSGVNVAQVFERVAQKLPRTEAHLASSRAFGASSGMSGTGSRLDLGRDTGPTRSCC